MLFFSLLPFPSVAGWSRLCVCMLSSSVLSIYLSGAYVINWPDCLICDIVVVVVEVELGK